MKQTDHNFDEKRSYPRFRMRVPNALRIVSSDGECVADLLDVSMSGSGIEHFDLIHSHSLNPGDVVSLEFLIFPSDINSPEVSQLIKTKLMELNPVLTDFDFQGGIKELQNLRFNARVAWIYLNRLGFEFIQT
ncbi:MAG: PilZ domain-containing protein [Syntrophaceae bacterium]|nr:PilZ domain-containing protein [Syntrophaceae bacterium]